MENNYLNNMLKTARSKQVRRRMVALFSALVLILTTNQLKLKADTLERRATCGSVEHQHSEECHDEAGNIVCGLEEHIHTDACFQERPKADEVMPEAALPIEDGGLESGDDEFIVSSEIEIPPEESDSFELGEPEEPAPETDVEEETAAVESFVTPVYDFNGASYALLSDILAGAGLDMDKNAIDEVGESVFDDDQQLSISVVKDGEEYTVTALRDFIDDDMVELVVFTKDRGVYLVNLKNGIAYEPAEAAVDEEQPVPVEPAPVDDEDRTSAATTDDEDTADEPPVPAESAPVEDEERATVEATGQPSAPVEDEASEPVIEQTDGEAEATAAPTSTPAPDPESADEQSAADITSTATAEPINESITENRENEDPPQEAVEDEEQPGAAVEDEEQPEESVTEDEKQPEEDASDEAEEQPEEDASGEAEERPEESVSGEAEEHPDEASGTVYTATIDLTDRSAPFSLLEMIGAAAPAEELLVQEEQQAEEALDPSDWTLEYDEELLEVVFEDGDYLITPKAFFEAATIRIEAGDSYVLNLVNYQLPMSYPAQSFEAFTATMTVKVTADEGAFPEGTTMEVADVEDEATISDIAGAVEGENVTVNRVHAVDITFRDAEGKEIEPLIPISVVMEVNEQTQSADAVVVHVDGEGNAEVLEQTGAGNEVAFDAETFSVYAVVITEKYISANGESYNIQVSYSSEAGIPDGAALMVEEVVDQEYLDMASAALGADKAVRLARFFDISIMADGGEIQPDGSVTVKVTLEDAVEADEVKAVHFGEDDVDVINVEEDSGTLSFQAERFSVYGIVYTVDFSFEDAQGNIYTYNLAGGGEMLLSELFVKLNIEADLTGSEVRFSDDMPEGLIELTAVKDVDGTTTDWQIKSLAPFATVHRLIVTLADGTIITIGVTDAQSGDFGNGVTWSLDDEGTLTISGNGEVPEPRNDAGSNHPWASLKSSIKRIVVEEGVTKLSNYCFESCSNLEEAVLPESLQIIGNGCFSKCTALAEINLEDCVNLTRIGSVGSNLSEGKGAFLNCTALKKDIDLTHCKSLATIGAHTFRGSGITRLDVSGCTALTAFDHHALANCSGLTSIDFTGSGVTSIGEYAFENCSALKTVDFTDCKGLTTINMGVFNKNAALTSVDFTGCALLQSINNQKNFRDLKALQSVKFTDCASLEMLGTDFFNGCSALSTVDFTGCTGLKYLGAGDSEETWAYTFKGCTSLKSIDLTPCVNLKRLGVQAFNGCTNLQSVDMSGLSALESIGGLAFQNCTSLTDVDFTGCEKVTWLGESAFQACKKLETLDLSAFNLDELHALTFCDCFVLDTIDLSGSTNLDSIGKRAFYANSFNQAGTRNVILPENCALKTIGAADDYSDVFRMQKYLESFDMSKFPDLEVIHPGTFRQATVQEAVDLSTNMKLKTIGKYAFMDSHAYGETLDLSGHAALETIDEMAFYNSYGLKAVDLSGCSNLTSIGKQAFTTNNNNSYPYMITAVDLTGAGTAGAGFTIGEDAFKGQKNLETIDFGNAKVIEIGTNAFSGCTSLYEANLENCKDLTTIGPGAFQNSVITQLTIPEGVTSISATSFSGCSSIATLNWNATDYTGTLDQSTFSAANAFDLRIGSNVTSLPANFMAAMRNAETVYFDSVPGGHVISLANGQASVINTEHPLKNVTATKIYVDEQGVVYELFNDKTARVAYCPPGITSYTVPESITTDGGCYDVTAIGESAFTRARDLTQVTFENVDSIISVGDSAFYGLKNLTSVVAGDTATTISNAQRLFEHADVPDSAFTGTGLTDDVNHAWLSMTPWQSIHMVDSGVEIDIIVEDKSTNSQGSGFTPASEGSQEGYYSYLTDDSMTLKISTPQTTGASTDKKLRVYVAFSEPQQSLAGFTKVGDGSESMYWYTDIDPNDFTGGNVTQTYGITYPSGVAGGDVFVWGEFVDGTAAPQESAYTNMDGHTADEHYLHGEWHTRRRERDTSKSSVNVDVRIVGDGDPDPNVAFEDRKYYVNGFNYKIFLNIANGRADDKGADKAIACDYTDYLMLPEGIEWESETLAAIRAGSYTLKTRKDDEDRVRYYLYANGKELIYMACPVDATAVNLRFSVDEYDRVVAAWTLKSKYERKNNQSVVQEMSTNEVTFGVLDGALVMVPSHITVEENGATRQITEEDFPRTFVITNHVDTRTSYQFSALLPDEAEATTSVTAYPEIMSILKTSDAEGATLHLGDDVTYTITVRNDGALPSQGIACVRDTLDNHGQPGGSNSTSREDAKDNWLLYIRPENMARMFQEAHDRGLELVITIQNADAYEYSGAGTTVNPANGSESVTLTAQNTGATNNRTAALGTLTVTCTWDGDDPTYSVGEYSGDDIETLLDRLHYLVDHDDLYTVQWNFKQGDDTYKFTGGLSMDLPIYASHKDTFQLMTYEDTDFTPHFMRNKSGEKLFNWSRDFYNQAVMRYKPLGQTEEEDRTTNYVQHTVVYELNISKGMRTTGEVTASAQNTNWLHNNVATYTVGVSNSSTKTFDDVPVTDAMTGSQLLLARVSENGGMSIDGHSPSALNRVTLSDGVEYYVLADPNNAQTWTFHDVVLGPSGMRAATVTVTPRAETLTLDGEAGDEVNVYEYDTDVRWYFDRLRAGSDIQVNYNVMTGVFLQSGVENTVSARQFRYNNVAYVNDRVGDRLFATLGGKGSTYGIGKKIVENPGPGYAPADSEYNHFGEAMDADDFTLLTYVDNTAMYKLSITYNPSNPDYTVSFRGSDIYDLLPETYGIINWTLADSYSDVGTEGKVFIEVVKHDREDNSGNNGQITLNGISAGAGSSNGLSVGTHGASPAIVLPSDASITMQGTCELDFYVTLTFADAERWRAYCNEAQARLLKNTFHVVDKEASVQHDLRDAGLAYLQKGVNYIYQSSPTDSRTLYYNNKGLVEYYAVVYNGGNSRMYLEALTDVLPTGFTFHGVYPQAYAYSNATKNTRSYSCVTLNQAMLPSDQSLWPAVITDNSPLRSDPDRQVRFVRSNVTADVTNAYTASGAAKQRIRFALTSPNYDSTVEHYYLLPGEAIAFAYLTDVDEETAHTDYEALNRIYMNNYDPTGLGVNIYEFPSGGVTGAIRSIETNDGGCAAYNVSAEGVNGMQSYVYVNRGSMVIGIDKQVKTYRRDEHDTDHTITDKVLSEASEYFGWEVDAYNQGAILIDGYTLTDTMQYPYRPYGDVMYSVVTGNRVSSVYDADFTTIKPLFTILDYDDKVHPTSVRVQGMDGSVRWIGVDAAPQKLNISAMTAVYGQTEERYKSTEQAPLYFYLSFVKSGSNNLKMVIQFPASNVDSAIPAILPIPPTGFGKLEMQTYAFGNPGYNGAYRNMATLEPEDTAFSVGSHGSAFSQGGTRRGVRFSDTVIVITGGSTRSWKEVEEKVHSDNAASSLGEPDDTIILHDQSNSFTYHLNIEDSYAGTLSEMIVIDNLPDIDDTFPIPNIDKDNTDNYASRGSEYKVYFKDGDSGNTGVALDNRQETMTAPDGKPDDLKITVDGVEYTAVPRDSTVISANDHKCWVEFSQKTQFDRNTDLRDQDPDGHWVDMFNITDLKDYRSIRVTIPGGQINKGTETPKVSIQIDFSAYADQTASLEGLTAWNGFAYGYSFKELGDDHEDKWQSAMPGTVGVQMPCHPRLLKNVTDVLRKTRAVSTESEFYFLVYKDALEGESKVGTKALRLLALSQLVESIGNDEPVLTEEAKTILGTEGVDWHMVKLNVAANQSASAAKALYWYEFWQPDGVYTIQELELSDDFRLNGFFDTNTAVTMGETATFTYAPDVTRSVTASNAYLPWEMKLTKTDSNTGAPLAGAVFALYSLDENDAAGKKYCTELDVSQDVYAYDGLSISTHYVERKTATESHDWYLIDVVTTDATGALTWPGLLQARYQYKEYKAPDGYNMPLVDHWEIAATDAEAGVYVIAQDVPNEPGFELPSTGGPGTTLFTASGLSLVLLALVLLLRKKQPY